MTRLLRVLLYVVIAGVALAALVVVAWRSSWGERQLTRIVERQAERALDGEVTIARVHGNLLRGATVDGLTITREGQPLVSAERLQLRYDAIGLVQGHLTIDEVTLVRPVVHLVRGPDGVTLFDLFETDEVLGTTPRPYSIDTLRIVDGRVLVGAGVVSGDMVRLPETLDDVQAELRVERTEDATSVAITHLSFVGSEPLLILQRLSGSIRLGDDDLAFDRVTLETNESVVTLNGSLRDFARTGGTQ